MAKKYTKHAVMLAAAAGLAFTSAPAMASKDGEYGYTLGCLMGWLLFGLTETCKELQP